MSEAVLLATAACYFKIEPSLGINQNVLKEEFSLRKTKLLINIFNGGKILGSAVKFAKFYLIIDAHEKSAEIDLTECFVKFIQNIKKTVQSTK